MSTLPFKKYILQIHWYIASMWWQVAKTESNQNWIRQNSSTLVGPSNSNSNTFTPQSHLWYASCGLSWFRWNRQNPLKYNLQVSVKWVIIRHKQNCMKLIYNNSIRDIPWNIKLPKLGVLSISVRHKQLSYLHLFGDTSSLDTEGTKWGNLRGQYFGFNNMQKPKWDSKAYLSITQTN